MDGEFTLRCQEPGCKGQRIVNHPLGVGWTIGMIVKFDSSEPEKGTCPLCKNGNMMITSLPKKAPEIPPKGFYKVPTK